MNKTLTTAATALLLAGLAACSSSNSTTSGGSSSNDKPSASAAASAPLTAQSAFQKISVKVSSAKLSGTVTAENDPNHLLGRPNQYTSKATFSDTRIAASDVTGADKGDVDRGGAIEVFANPADAKARATYIQNVTKAMSALAEYDYVHGTVLVRVSHYLTPKQAGEYEAAAKALG